MFNIGMILAGFFLCLSSTLPSSAWPSALSWEVWPMDLQLPGLRREGYRYRPVVSFRDPGVKADDRPMTPAIVGLASTQINIFVNT